MTIQGMPENEAERNEAQAWTDRLTTRTLATGDRLFEHICRFKIVNRVPFTAQERAYLDRVIAARQT